MKIDRDTFEEWLAHPLTEALMKCCLVWAEEAKTNWIVASWDGGEPNPVLLARMKERVRVLDDIRTINAEQIEETLSP